MATLVQLLVGVDAIAIEGDPEIAIAEVRDDSRRVGVGDLFVAQRGQTVDGHAFLAKARAQGAVAAVVEDPGARFDGVRVLVPSAARALGQIAANRHGRPGEAMRLVGVTGTNGKTTVSYLVEALIGAAGGRPGVIGTVAYRSPAGSRPAPFTTPTPLELHATLAEMLCAGCTHVVMECSSHALALDRLEGLRFATAGFTNLTQDHLDFHRDMDDYAAAKARLFSERLAEGGVAVICVDGPYGERMVQAARGPVLRVSTSGAGDVRVTRAVPVAAGTALEVETSRGRLDFVSPLVGAFNVENLAVATGLGLGLGFDPDTIAAALSTAHGAPGRLERIASVDGTVAAYVDYAHTPDALERALAALRPTTRGRLWVVFGCGGDRDRGKRPQMGAIAAAGADLVVVTSDNPRTEAPGAILDEILTGIDEPRVAPKALAERGVTVVEDRRAAIRLAVAGARAGDVILVAGKGHEDYQIIGITKAHFDDREELRAAFAARS